MAKSNKITLKSVAISKTNESGLTPREKRSRKIDYILSKKKTPTRIKTLEQFLNFFDDYISLTEEPEGTKLEFLEEIMELDLDRPKVITKENRLKPKDKNFKNHVTFFNVFLMADGYKISGSKLSSFLKFDKELNKYPLQICNKHLRLSK